MLTQSELQRAEEVDYPTLVENLQATIKKLSDEHISLNMKIYQRDRRIDELEIELSEIHAQGRDPDGVNDPCGSECKCY